MCKPDRHEEVNSTSIFFISVNILFPTIPWKYIPPMLGISLMGTLVVGSYGILHDQITYSISAEYFTKLKFHQFHYANFGFPVRVLLKK